MQFFLKQKRHVCVPKNITPREEGRTDIFNRFLLHKQYFEVGDRGWGATAYACSSVLKLYCGVEQICWCLGARLNCRSSVSPRSFLLYIITHFYHVTVNLKRMLFYPKKNHYFLIVTLFATIKHIFHSKNCPHYSNKILRTGGQMVQMQPT